MNYTVLRNLHLIFGLMSLPFLLMYVISAVQMAHGAWFRLKPEVTERQIGLMPGIADSVDLLGRINIKGDVQSVQSSNGNWQVRIVVPGTVNEVSYDGRTGIAKVKTSRAGIMGMLNRLHHAGGLWPGYVPLKVWGAMVGIVSMCVVGMAATGLWMWWLRKQDRLLGMVLIGANLIFAVIMLGLIRSEGP
ncbi:MAG: hypothetical protein H7Y20_06750 [Bryobacteraceae bacterium]|nr:hypothetical protein [Bryobacteraceae bacterium]